MRHWHLLAGLSCLAACGGVGRELSPITIDSLPTLGTEQGEGAMATWPRVSPRHPLGYRVVVPQAGAGGEVPLVFGDDGTFLGTLGTPGNGPGQFIEPLFARIGPGDSLWVFDGTARVAVFSPERTFVREVTLPVAPWDAAILPDGRLLVASASSAAPMPLVLLDGTGAVVREIGAPAPGEPLGTMRRITIAPDGTIWTVALLGNWRLEHWDTAGTALGEIMREPLWFAPYDRYEAPAPGTPPQPTLQGAWFDADGRLWVLGKAVDEAWATGVGALEVGGGEAAQSVITDPDRVYDTVLEVIDPATGEVTAMARLDVAWPFLAEPGVVMRVVTDGNGVHRAALGRVQLAPAQP